MTVRKPWLPDAQERLSIGLPACKDDCYPLAPDKSFGARVIIMNGAFQAGPFTVHGDGAPIDAGIYPIAILLETGNTYGPNPDFFHKVYDGQLVIGPDEKAAGTARLSPDQRGAIGDHVRECWTKDAGALDTDKQHVLLMVTTDAAGIARVADVTGSDLDRMGDPRFRAFAERAKRAILDSRCATLPLPSTTLGRVNTLTVRFSP